MIYTASAEFEKYFLLWISYWFNCKLSTVFFLDNIKGLVSTLSQPVTWNCENHDGVILESYCMSAVSKKGLSLVNFFEKLGVTCIVHILAVEQTCTHSQKINVRQDCG